MAKLGTPTVDFCACERCFPFPIPRNVLVDVIGHSKQRCDLCNRAFLPNEQAAHFLRVDSGFLRHAASCSSQYDGLVRRLAAELLFYRIREEWSRGGVTCFRCVQLWDAEERRVLPKFVGLHRYTHVAIDQERPFTYPVTTLCGREVLSREMERTPSKAEDELQASIQEAVDQEEDKDP